MCVIHFVTADCQLWLMNLLTWSLEQVTTHSKLTTATSYWYK